MNDKKDNNNDNNDKGSKVKGEGYASQFGLKSAQSLVRRINPLGFRVLVQVLKQDNKTDGGLYLPEGSKEAMQESLLVEVLEVASASDEDSDSETNVSGVPLGAKVLIPKNAGIKIPWDPDLRIVDTEDVLAVVSEVSLV